MWLYTWVYDISSYVIIFHHISLCYIVFHHFTLDVFDIFLNLDISPNIHRCQGELPPGLLTLLALLKDLFLSPVAIGSHRFWDVGGHSNYSMLLFGFNIVFTLWSFDIAMDNGPFIDGSWWFTYWTWWFSIAMIEPPKAIYIPGKTFSGTCHEWLPIAFSTW